jgi:hypothetical protein
MTLYKHDGFKDGDKPKTVYLGSLWKKEGQYGKYLSGVFKLEGQEINILVYPRKKRDSDKDPHYNILLNQKKTGGAQLPQTTPRQRWAPPVTNTPEYDEANPPPLTGLVSLQPERSQQTAAPMSPPPGWGDNNEDVPF